MQGAGPYPCCIMLAREDKVLPTCREYSPHWHSGCSWIHEEGQIPTQTACKIKKKLSSETRILILWFLCNRHTEVQGVTDRWLHGLPALLVQLRDKSPGMTQLIVGILKRAVVQGALKPDDNFLTHLAMFFCKCSEMFHVMNLRNNLKYIIMRY